MSRKSTGSRTSLLTLLLISFSDSQWNPLISDRFSVISNYFHSFFISLTRYNIPDDFYYKFFYVHKKNFRKIHQKLKAKRIYYSINYVLLKLDGISQLAIYKTKFFSLRLGLVSINPFLTVPVPDLFLV
jgi:hypothetical protein